MGERRRRFTITAEVTVDVTDVDTLRKAALDRVAEAGFVAHGDRSVDQTKAAEHDAVRDNVTAALDWVTDPDAIVQGGVGADVIGSTTSITEAERADSSAGDADGELMPDFAALFPACVCGADDCENCSGFQLTPRSAAILWGVAQLHADFAYEDVQQHGDAPVTEPHDDWVAFADYPRITWAQDAVWWRQAARAFDDLAAGQPPLATCPGEEMAMHLMLRSADGAAADGWGVPQDELALLPAHDDDYNWDLAVDVLLQDEDILHLFDRQLDGIEDPESEENKRFRIGDYRPEAWFRPFQNATPRDARRPFRR
ncbi:hypothetical protein [Winogradskya humida]|uniref:Uncharacterized protein n=1 Tax=Winogradskya humida TaxID=113566 RepID=A0ABQ4A7M4_9ACTN|nr:hypothetical protein [Actinoplanes humidus]GIE26860.1 hypothetical protein Ahu01nite_099620 [Actinoplanes humidus]